MHPAMPSSTDHSACFSELDLLLSRHVDLWQIRAFHKAGLCWEDTHPDLCAALLDLDEDKLQHLENNETALADWLEPWLGIDGQRLYALISLPQIPHRPLEIPDRFETGIPGRKWQQIQAFAATLPAEPRPVLEWCAGKGHLGRLLAVTDARPVTSLEWNGSLCQAGRNAAARIGATMRFVESDALAADSARWLADQGQAVALHACGDLHTTLMRHWVESDCQRLTLSPCCYHLIRSDSYQPLSEQGSTSVLRLSKLDLQLPLQETVTGGLGVQRQRRTELLWRLAFDEWQREWRGRDEYLPLPPFAKSLLTRSFTEFCQWAAVTKKLPTPGLIDESCWLERGKARLRQVRLMELVSHFFRRPLELWLVLDRVLFLEEHGARVVLGTFCDKPLTPRNILIDAEWP
ncbi:MAG: hypothetical protein VR73_01990 [Gammaproteobacteria bacterium BRH_c0]|nr:MAG: hypothetical protein VR73_01990 [Gammaproteobacteria bacterium BRH_c0]